MFWRKKGVEEKGKKKKAVKKIAGPLWAHMVMRYRVTDDVLQNLRRVERHGLVEDKPVIMIRMFDLATADKKGVSIEDFESLDDHPELVLYAGYYHSVLGVATDIHIEKKQEKWLGSGGKL